MFYYALLAFVLVGFQGWLGSKVVSFELHPLVVTLHMLVALVIVGILIYLYGIINVSNVDPNSVSVLKFRKVGYWVIGISLLQVILGTQVRENVDEVSRLVGFENRSIWMESLDALFLIHRSFSILVLISNIYWIRLHKQVSGFQNNSLINWCAAVLGLEILTGIIMSYFNIPAAVQPVHLTLGLLLLGLQYMVVLKTYPTKKVIHI